MQTSAAPMIIADRFELTDEMREGGMAEVFKAFDAHADGALVFKAPRSSDLRVFFVVNGVRDEDLERRFAEAGGTARRGFVRAFSDAYLSANLRRHLGAEVTQKMIDPSSYLVAQRTVSIAKIRREGLARKAAMVAKGQLAPNEAPDAQSIADATAAEHAAVQQIENALSRPAAVYEKAEMLARALASATKRLSISSKGLAPHIVDKVFLGKARRLVPALPARATRV